MKRIGIIYAGRDFSIGQEDFDRMKEEIEAAHRDGVATWIRVNHGEGRPQPAELLIGPGIPIAILPIPPDLVEPAAPGEVDAAAAAVEGDGRGAGAVSTAIQGEVGPDGERVPIE
ncbi:hypothetical protein [Agromyces sp. NPDC055661]|jgi:hypothetical protein